MTAGGAPSFTDLPVTRDLYDHIPVPPFPPHRWSSNSDFQLTVLQRSHAACCWMSHSVPGVSAREPTLGLMHACLCVVFPVVYSEVCCPRDGVRRAKFQSGMLDMIQSPKLQN